MRSSTISAVCSVITFPPLEKGRGSQKPADHGRVANAAQIPTDQ